MKRMVSVILTIAAVALAFAIGLAEMEPCEDYPIEVLNEDPCGDSKWIAISDSATICLALCLKETPDECGLVASWIGGTVAFDEFAEDMFYFDPATVRIAEITAEALQTTLCAMIENPKEYDGGLWYIPYNVIEVK